MFFVDSSLALLKAKGEMGIIVKKCGVLILGTSGTPTENTPSKTLSPSGVIVACSSGHPFVERAELSDT